MLELGRACTSFADACATILRWPDRPFGTVALIYSFHRFDEWLPGYALLGFVSGALLMLFTAWMAAELTRSRIAMAVSATVIAVLPQLTETFQWPTMVAYGFGFAAYPAAGWAGLRFLRTGFWPWAVASGAFYLFGMGTYEVGLALPIAFAALWWSRSRTRIVVLAGVWGMIGALYLAWKLTSGFGFAHDLLFPVRKVDLSEGNLVWNAVEAARWWVGGHAWHTVMEGWKGFSALDPERQRGLVLGTLTVVTIWAACMRFLRESRTEQPASIHPAAMLSFSACWFAAGQILNLVSWSGGRLCVLPAVGLAIGAGYLASRLRTTTWMPAAVVVLALWITANQGTSRQWQIAGQSHRALLDHMRAERAEWTGKRLIYIDSRSLRSRQVTGMRMAEPLEQRYWAYWGNASLLRGFVMRSIVKLAADGGSIPETILDVEHGASVDDHLVRWTGWYNPGITYSAPRSEVYVVDFLAVASPSESQ